LRSRRRAGSLLGCENYNRAAVAVRSPAQLARRRRIEGVIRIAGPFLDLVLLAGGQLSRVAGRNGLESDPAPPAMTSGSAARRARRLARGSRG
jgi:hypothetical protein